MSNPMTQARYQALIAAYGADPLRWPDDERAAAQSFQAAQMASADPALEEAVALDTLLSTADVPPLSFEKMVALQKQARPGLLVRLRRFFEWQGPLWQPAGALTAALMFGAVLGLADPDTAAAISAMTGLEEISVTVPDADLDFDPFGEDGL